jgi:hypothetical protein
MTDLIQGVPTLGNGIAIGLRALSASWTLIIRSARIAA